MSDETPPPLRLKPRSRLEGEAAPSAPTPSPAAPPPAAAEPAAGDAAGKLRLKPKISLAPAAETPAAAPAAPTPPPPPPAATPAEGERPRLKPRMSLAPAAEPAPALAPAPEPIAAPPPPPPSPPPPAPEPPPPEVSEPVPAESAAAEDAAPKFKLKVKPAGGGPARMPGAPAPAAGSAEAPKDPPPFPVVKPPGPTRPPLAVPHMRAPEGVEEEDIQPKAPPPKKFGKKKNRWLLPVVGLVVLGVAGFVVYKFFLAPPPPPAPVVKKPAAPAPVAKPAAAPQPAQGGGLIDAGQNAITERRAKEQARVDALLNGQDVPDARAIATPPPSSLSGAPATAPKPAPGPTTATAQATTQISPGLSVTSATELTAGAASAAFRTFVANARINGVFQGNPPKAFINNTLYRAGDLVSPTLGIRFFGLNSEQKTITFRDESGAIVTRKY